MCQAVADRSILDNLLTLCSCETLCPGRVECTSCRNWILVSTGQRITAGEMMRDRGGMDGNKVLGFTVIRTESGLSKTLGRGSFRQMVFGYARVSSADQNLPIRSTYCRGAAGIDAGNIYIDHGGGAQASHPKSTRCWRVCVVVTGWSSPAWTGWVARCCS